MQILVLGAGAWGTALASAASGQGRHAVTLWARDFALAQSLQSDRVNSRYLPGVVLPDGLAFAGGALQPVLRKGVRWDLIIIATPMAALRDMLHVLADVAVPAVWLCKGFEAARGGYRTLFERNYVPEPVSNQMAEGAEEGIRKMPLYGLKRGGSVSRALDIARKINGR